MRDKNEVFGARHPNENMKCKTCVHADGSECEYYKMRK